MVRVKKRRALAPQPFPWGRPLAASQMAGVKKEQDEPLRRTGRRRQAAAEAETTEFPNRPPIAPKPERGPGDAAPARAWPPVEMRVGAAAGPLVPLAPPADPGFRRFRGCAGSRGSSGAGSAPRLLAKDAQWSVFRGSVIYWFRVNPAENGWTALCRRDESVLRLRDT